MKISACWIVKNEADNLARSIRSLQSGVDEMVVVDTGSSDNTVEVAQSLGARVEHFAWIQDFAAARNYALSKATGDVIIFLDADEWFVPEFGPAQKTEVVQIFSSDLNVDAGNIPLTNLDGESNIVLDQIAVTRMFRKSENIHYSGAIHEILVDDTRASLRTVETRYNANHTGYSRAIMQDKMVRNIEMLETAVQDAALQQDEKEIIKLNAYLMRECRIAGRHGQEFEKMKWLLNQPKTMKVLADYPILATSYAFSALDCGIRNRNQVSRSQMYQAIVLKMQKELPKDPSTQLIHLTYEYAYNLQEEKLMREVALQLPYGRWQENEIIDKTFWRRLAILYVDTGMAYWRRGNKPKTLEYMSLAFMVSADFMDENALSLLLFCMRGQPETEQILLLEKLFGSANKAKMDWLMRKLRTEKNTNIYLYYFKKQLDKQWASKVDYCYIQLLQGNDTQLLEILSEGMEAGGEDALVEAITLAAIGLDHQDLLQQYQGQVKSNRAILDAYFEGTALEEPGFEDALKLLLYYPVLAALDEEKAERFRRVFINNRYDYVNTRLLYCNTQEQYAKGMQEDLSEVRDNVYVVNSYLTCVMKSREYGLLLELVAAQMEKYEINQETLAILQVAAEQANGEQAAELRSFYEQARAAYWEYIDTAEYLNTGFTTEQLSKKEMRALGTLTPKMLEERLERDGSRLAVPNYCLVLQMGAQAYEEQGLLLNALHLYQRLLVLEYRTAENWLNAGRIYAQAGNSKVAEHCAKRAKALE